MERPWCQLRFSVLCSSCLLHSCNARAFMEFSCCVIGEAEFAQLLKEAEDMGESEISVRLQPPAPPVSAPGPQGGAFAACAGPATTASAAVPASPTLVTNARIDFPFGTTINRNDSPEHWASNATITQRPLPAAGLTPAEPATPPGAGHHGAGVFSAKTHRSATGQAKQRGLRATQT